MNSLAYAEAADNSGSNFNLVVISVAVIIVIAAMAFVPVAISWSRRQRNSEAVVVLAIFWGVLSGGSVIYSCMSQMKWARENTLRLETGYDNPDDKGDAPGYPILFWTGLGVAYCGLVAWPLSKKREAGNISPSVGVGLPENPPPSEDPTHNP